MMADWSTQGWKHALGSGRLMCFPARNCKGEKNCRSTWCHHQRQQVQNEEPAWFVSLCFLLVGWKADEVSLGPSWIFGTCGTVGWRRFQQRDMEICSSEDTSRLSIRSWAQTGCSAPWGRITQPSEDTALATSRVSETHREFLIVQDADCIECKFG